MGAGKMLLWILPAAAALLLAACSSGTTSSLDQPRNDAGVQAQLDAAAVPRGVDAATWAQLKAELARVLAARPVAQASLLADNAGKHGGLPHQVSTPPSGIAAAAKLVHGEVEDTLAWGYVCPGDYNQDGEVGIGDLTPLGLHFGEVSPAGAGQPFPWDSVGAVVDGDANGVIGITDVTPLGANFGRRVEGYNVYRSFDSADYPLTPTAANGGGAQSIGALAMAQATGAAAAGRRQFSFALTNPPSGAFYWVRPYDGVEDGTPSNLVAGAGANLPPIAAIAADPPAGGQPLTVQFNAQASYDDDGSIVKYEWDFDGPLNGEQWEDTGTTPTAQHTYEKPGDYFPTLRVTDDDGATATDFTQVIVKIPPLAKLTFSTVPGIYKHLLWDASKSSDTDGRILKYEWDFDGDGVYEYDAASAGETPAEQALQDFYYYESGDYTVGVRVTDNDGLTATASKTAAPLYVGATWHVTQVDERLGDSMAYGIPRNPFILNVLDRPALIYSRLLDELDPVTNNSLGTAYLRASDQFGETWPEPEIVFASDVRDAAIVNGRPAFICNYSVGESPTTADVYEVFLRAAESTEFAWDDPVEFNHYRLDAGGVAEGLRIAAGYPEWLIDVEGRPAVIGFDDVNPPGGYTMALDTNGHTWPAPHKYGAQFTSYPHTAVATIEGLPATASYVNEKDIIYQRALDYTAIEWSSAELADESEMVGGTPALLDIEGAPAVIYFDVTSECLKYRLATDAEGSTWLAPRTLTNRSTGDFSATVVDGRPFVMYKDRIDEQLYTIAGNDPRGASWSLPASASTLGDQFTEAFAYDSAGFTDVAGRPASGYREQFSGPDNNLWRLEYVSYY